MRTDYGNRFNALPTQYVMNHYKNGKLAMGWDGHKLHTFFNGSEISDSGQEILIDFSKARSIMGQTTMPENGWLHVVVSNNETSDPWNGTAFYVDGHKVCETISKGDEGMDRAVAILPVKKGARLSWSINSGQLDVVDIIPF